MSGSRRNQIITDQIVQGELMFRAIVYWFFCLLVVELLVMGWSMITGPARPMQQVIRESLAISAPAIFGSVLLLPLVLMDVIRVSNRFVGPMQSIRCTMRQLANDEPARRVYLRRDDFWQELAHYTNTVADRMETEEFDAESDSQDDAEFGNVSFLAPESAQLADEFDSQILGLETDEESTSETNEQDAVEV